MRYAEFNEPIATLRLAWTGGRFQRIDQESNRRNP